MPLYDNFSNKNIDFKWKNRPARVVSAIISSTITYYCSHTPLIRQFLAFLRVIFPICCIEFPFYVDIVQTEHGFNRVHHMGKSYGVRNNKVGFRQRQVWVCTRTDGTRKRCPASIETNFVDGCTTMRLKNTEHICSTAYEWTDRAWQPLPARVFELDCVNWWSTMIDVLSS